MEELSAGLATPERVFAFLTNGGQRRLAALAAADAAAAAAKVAAEPPPVVRVPLERGSDCFVCHERDASIVCSRTDCARIFHEYCLLELLRRNPAAPLAEWVCPPCRATHGLGRAVRSTGYGYADTTPAGGAGASAKLANTIDATGSLVRLAGKAHDDICSACASESDGDNLVLCDGAGCSRVYHIACDAELSAAGGDLPAEWFCIVCRSQRQTQGEIILTESGDAADVARAAGLQSAATAAAIPAYHVEMDGSLGSGVNYGATTVNVTAASEMTRSAVDDTHEDFDGFLERSPDVCAVADASNVIAGRKKKRPAAAAAAAAPAIVSSGRRMRRTTAVALAEAGVAGDSEVAAPASAASPVAASAACNDNPWEALVARVAADHAAAAAREPPPHYAKLSRSVWRCERPKASRDEDGGGDEAQCCCSADGTQCGDACHNRASSMECTRRNCGYAEDTARKCRNRDIQRRNRAPVVARPAGESKGWGLFAAEPIPAGTFVIEYVGEVLDDEGSGARMAEYKAAGVRHFHMMEVRLQHHCVGCGSLPHALRQIATAGCHPSTAYHLRTHSMSTTRPLLRR